ncbi:molybdopterin synthase catalytic subunit MoaE [Chromobacterium sphagni]|uniref:Molybdopterin synthase catalytic subunit n=1 Tax=Chromobacterium sphagni TaxID=1903179 RepID=A0A1S1WXS3_9NEIS|nr:molybdopterin synthase catalytic subunit MoaE [Chromobacterium sphagni]OHX12091.1 molybdenum cofactor biosynthesis protein MoaE [Chromobacterium sphagni]OHX21826.1 molybdenum cofactor biosynthesis protein MoaE [Chromobacterium sphagni]
MAVNHIRVQVEDFDVGAEVRRWSANPACGAVVSFTGLVRDYGDRQDVVALELEHYPGMTEKALAGIVCEARQRWSLKGVTLIHRVGRLALGEPIVLVVAASSHRRDAFEAANFLMDYLKQHAPFWKCEILADGSRHWVEARAGDAQAAARWDADAGAKPR